MQEYQKSAIFAKQYMRNLNSNLDSDNQEERLLELRKAQTRKAKIKAMKEVKVQAKKETRNTETIVKKLFKHKIEKKRWKLLQKRHKIEKKKELKSKKYLGRS